MDRCSLLAPAKINLYLEIIGDRPDGYHELAMVMQSVDLCDRIVMERSGTDDISLKCPHPLVPSDETNLAYRAADLMRQQFGNAFARFGGVKIQIEKTIPVGAGLAGGSGNAAAVLVGLDLLWQLGLTAAELQQLGAKLGSDVPFCISGGTALATGRGEQVAPLQSLQNAYVVLAKYQSLSVSTPWAYQAYRNQFEATYVRAADDLASRQSRVHSGPMVAAIMAQDLGKISQLLHNDLEKVVLPEHPKVQELRDALGRSPLAQGVMMSGSGPTVFALAASQSDADGMVQSLRASFADPDLGLWVAPFSNQGIRLAEA
jgi:4-diphosphocytidyl-2-C-methyl-D-erythritol kinase